MPVTINGTTGITTPAENTSALTVGSITGILKASSGVVAQAVAGSDYGQLTLATAQTAPFTAPNTYADFTGIPSWAKRITVNFNGVSTSGTSNYLVQIGSGSITNSGYTSSAHTSANSDASSTSGFLVLIQVVSTVFYSGSVVLNLSNTYTYTQTSVISPSSLNAMTMAGGWIALGGNLDRIRITTVNGTDTFDAGTINISYE